MLTYCAAKGRKPWAESLQVSVRGCGEVLRNLEGISQRHAGRGNRHNSVDGERTVIGLTAELVNDSSSCSVNGCLAGVVVLYGGLPRIISGSFA